MKWKQLPLRLDDHHSVSWKNMNQVVRLVAPGKLFPNSVSVENNVVESDAHSNAERGTAIPILKKGKKKKKRQFVIQLAC